MQQQNPNDEVIVEHLNYFNVLIASIQAINTAIMNQKDARDAAENLLSDIPEDWKEESKEQIETERAKYNFAIQYYNQFLQKGVPQSAKDKAQKNIYFAGKQYSLAIKNIVISLMKKKDLLYQTKNKIERNVLGIMDGINDEEDE